MIAQATPNLLNPFVSVVFSNPSTISTAIVCIICRSIVYCTSNSEEIARPFKMWSRTVKHFIWPIKQFPNPAPSSSPALTFGSCKPQYGTLREAILEEETKYLFNIPYELLSHLQKYFLLNGSENFKPAGPKWPTFPMWVQII